MNLTYDQIGLRYNQPAYTYNGRRLWQRTWSESRQGSATESVETSLSQEFTGQLSDVIEADVQVTK